MTADTERILAATEKRRRRLSEWRQRNTSSKELIAERARFDMLHNTGLPMADPAPNGFDPAPPDNE